MDAVDKVRPDLLEAGDFPIPFGRYNLLGILGEGGMARVFRAVLPALAGGMAVLVTSPNQSSPEQVHPQTGVELVLIPAGSFQMGSPCDEEGRGFAEGPQHEVRISQPFWMAKHEVTDAQYKRFVVATANRRPAY